MSYLVREELDDRMDVTHGGGHSKVKNTGGARYLMVGKIYFGVLQKN